MILAPIVRGRKGAYRKELEKLAQDGYVRARINGELVPLDETSGLDKRKNHTIEVVIDRLLVKPGIAARLEQSIATALKLAQGWSPSRSSVARIMSSPKNWPAQIAAFPFRNWSRVRSASILRTALARRATAWARNTISIRRE